MNTAGGLLDGKVVVIVGAGPGLGRRAATACAAAGASVVVSGRSESSLAETVTATGGADVVVYNAYYAGTMNVPVEHADLDVWRAAFDVNLFGAIRIARAAVPSMRRRGGGSIIAVGSQIARRVFAGRGPYATSKIALLGFVELLAKELGPDNIRVNALVPGRMRGPAFDANLAERAAAAGVEPGELARSIGEQLALGRIVTDEEVAGSVVYLASDLSAGVTGQAIDVNGGETFHAL